MRTDMVDPDPAPERDGDVVAFPSASAAAPEAGADTPRVGPNAVIQVLEAFAASGEGAAREAVFVRAGLERYLAAPPEEMIPENEAVRLHAALFACMPTGEAARLAADAGRRTGEYIMANRIPGFARTILRALPSGLAAPMLAKAIVRHAWTFCGSGEVTQEKTGPRRIEIVIAPNRLATPDCPWHRAVFETLFRRLAAPKARVAHPECCARGDAACRYVIEY